MAFKVQYLLHLRAHGWLNYIKALLNMYFIRLEENYTEIIMVIVFHPAPTVPSAEERFSLVWYSVIIICDEQDRTQGRSLGNIFKIQKLAQFH